MFHEPTRLANVYASYAKTQLGVLGANYTATELNQDL